MSSYFSKGQVGARQTAPSLLFLVSFAQAKVRLMMAFEMMEKFRDDESASMPRTQMDQLVLRPLEQALNSAIVGADKYKSAL